MLPHPETAAWGLRTLLPDSRALRGPSKALLAAWQPRRTLSQARMSEAEVWLPPWSEKKEFSHVPFRTKDKNPFNWRFHVAPHVGLMSVVIQLATCGFLFFHSLLHVTLRTRAAVLTALGRCFILSGGWVAAAGDLEAATGLEQVALYQL